MTTIYLTDEDYEVLNSGDMDAIKRHFNEVRGMLVRNEAEARKLRETGEKLSREELLRGFAEGSIVL